MKNILYRINYCLNSEKGGPNLDALISIATGFTLIVGIWAIGRALYTYYYATPSVSAVEKAGVGEQTVVVGFKK